MPLLDPVVLTFHSPLIDLALFFSMPTRSFSVPAFQISSSCLYCLPCCLASLTSQCRFLSSIFHPLRPVYYLWSISHLYDRFSRDQVEVVHLVAVWTQYYEITDVVIAAVAIYVRHL